MYRQVIKESRPFGAVDARVVSVVCNGYIAVVQSIETVVPGTELKFAKKKNAPVVKSKVISCCSFHVFTYRMLFNFFMNNRGVLKILRAGRSTDFVTNIVI